MNISVKHIILLSMLIAFTGKSCWGAAACVKNDPDKRLLQAAREGNVRTLNRALKNKKTNIDAIDHWGFTPLMCAADRGHIEAVRILVAQRANIHIIDRFDGTALLGAAQARHGDIVALLIAANADSAAALERAISCDDEATAQFLRECGAKSAEFLVDDFDSSEFQEETSDGNI